MSETWRNIPTSFSWDGESVTVPEEKTGTVSVKKVPPIHPESSDKEDVFAAAGTKTEQLLDTVLGLVDVNQEVSEDEEVDGLWEKQKRDLPLSQAPVYPDGREIANANHLMLFLQNGADIVRFYTNEGWCAKLVRVGGKENPIPYSVFESLQQGSLVSEVRDGVFRYRAM